MAPAVLAGPARQAAADRQHKVVMAMIGLAVLAHLVRDRRSRENAIVVVIGLAAVAGLGRASRARSFERLAAWDKRRRLAAQHVSKKRAV
jgi:hypothetical protein